GRRVRQARGDRDRRRHEPDQPRGGGQQERARRRRRPRGRAGHRGRDHPGAGWRRPDDDRHALAQHARRRPTAGRAMKLRAGELTALAGIGATIASFFSPWYQSPSGNLTFWDTFGGAAVLMLAALAAAAAMVLATLLERDSPAIAVPTAVWSVVLGVIG